MKTSLKQKETGRGSFSEKRTIFEMTPSKNRKADHGRLKRIFDNPNLEAAELRFPFVTVIITNYNYGQYIVPCMESVARQTYPHFRCIVVDDCSTDDSVEKINRFISGKSLSHRFSLITHRRNGGQMSAFKTGLDAAEGVFIVYIDSDDIIFDDFIETHVRHHLKSKVSVAFTSSNQIQIDENNQILHSKHPDLDTDDKMKYVDGHVGIGGPWVWATTSSMMFRKSVLEMVMPEKTEPFRICADAYIARFAHMVSGSLLIPSSHGCYRRHGANNFSSNPFVGGVLPTGDMRLHPKDTTIKDQIIAHLAAHRETFVPVLSESGYLKIVLRLINRPVEFKRMSDKYPKLFQAGSNDDPRMLKHGLYMFVLMKHLKALLRKFVFRPISMLVKI